MAKYVEILGGGAKNFLRFGNTIFEFHIEEGLTNIFGKNGSGKSSILEIIHYVLFGESYRGVNLANLINDTNGKGLLAFVYLRITDGDKVDTYVIHRGMEPRIQKIFKNDGPEPIKGYSNFDKYIAETLLGFNANSHKKIIAVSSGGTPFLKMKLEEKRQIIDNITNISETKEYKTLTQHLLNECNSRLKLVEYDIKVNRSTLIPYKEMLDRSSLDMNARLEEVKNSIARLQVQLSESEEHREQLLLEKAELELSYIEASEVEKKLLDEYNSKDPKSINDKSIELNSQLKYLKEKAKDIQNEISKINPNVVCNHCGNSYSEDQANTKRSEKQLKYNEIVDEGRSVKLELDALNVVISELIEVSNRVRDAQASKSEISYKVQAKIHDINSINHTINNINSNLVEMETKTKKILSDNNNSEDIASINLKINEITNNITTLTTEQEELNQKCESYEYMIKMFSDDGIKSFILKKVLPMLNKLINYYIRLFDLKVTVELLHDYSHKMTSSSGYANDYDGLSGGQKQRINLAILFAQTDLIKIIGNFKTNILFLDEFIDGAVDSEGLNDTLRILKEISDRDNKSIVFISHRLDENIIREIDHFYEATKIDDSYSVLNKRTREDVLQILNIN